MATLPGETRMGAVHLSVGDLARSLDYYGNAIGLAVLDEGGGEATLGAAGTELLHLSEERGAGPADGYTGLFHFALLLPQRTDLARWIAHAARDRVQLTGASDHFVSEALYLRDPDHHGIEIYADRPRETWEGQVAQMTTLPLDIEAILATVPDVAAESFDGLPAGTTMGHVHLRVADVESSIGFYRDVLGFDLMAQLGPQAAFLAAGGYHHHLGGNTWESRGAGPAPAGTARLLRYTILVPTEDDRVAAAERLGGGERFHDPSGNPFVLAVG